MSQTVLWAGWSPDTLTLTAHNQDGSVQTVAITRTMPADWRYHLRLSAGAGGVLLRSAVAGRTLLERVTPTLNLEPIPLPAPLAALPPYRVLPQRSGTVLTLPNDGLTVWRPDAQPRAARLPDGFTVRDATQASDGRVFACGALTTHHLPGVREPRGAWAASHDDGNSWWISTRLGGDLLNTWRSVFSGAHAELRWVREVNGWLVFAALGGAPEDSTTSIAARAPHGRWYRATWPHDVFRAAVAVPGGVALLSHRGRRVILSEHSRRRDQLAPRLACALGADVDSRVEVLDATPGVLVVASRGARANWQGVTRLAADAVAPVSVTPLGTPEMITAIVR